MVIKWFKKRDSCIRIDIKIQASNNQERRIGLNAIVVFESMCIRFFLSFLIYSRLCLSLSSVCLTRCCFWSWIEQWLCMLALSLKPHANSAWLLFFMLNSIAHKSALKWIQQKKEYRNERSSRKKNENRISTTAARNRFDTERKKNRTHTQTA